MTKAYFALQQISRGRKAKPSTVNPGEVFLFEGSERDHLLDNSAIREATADEVALAKGKNNGKLNKSEAVSIGDVVTLESSASDENADSDEAQAVLDKASTDADKIRVDAETAAAQKIKDAEARAAEIIKEAEEQAALAAVPKVGDTVTDDSTTATATTADDATAAKPGKKKVVAAKDDDGLDV